MHIVPLHECYISRLQVYHKLVHKTFERPLIVASNQNCYHLFLAFFFLGLKNTLERATPLPPYHLFLGFKGHISGLQVNYKLVHKTFERPPIVVSEQNHHHLITFSLFLFSWFKERTWKSSTVITLSSFHLFLAILCDHLHLQLIIFS